MPPSLHPSILKTLEKNFSLWLLKSNNVFGTWPMHYLKAFTFNNCSSWQSIKSLHCLTNYKANTPATMQNWNNPKGRGKTQTKGKAKTKTLARIPLKGKVFLLAFSHYKLIRVHAWEENHVHIPKYRQDFLGKHSSLEVFNIQWSINTLFCQRHPTSP